MISSYHKELKYIYGIDSMLNLNASEYPTMKEVITNFQNWDRKGVADSKGAAVFLLVYDYVSKKLAGTPARELTKSRSGRDLSICT